MKLLEGLQKTMLSTSQTVKYSSKLYHQLIGQGTQVNSSMPQFIKHFLMKLNTVKRTKGVQHEGRAEEKFTL